MSNRVDACQITARKEVFEIDIEQLLEVWKQI